MTSPPTLHQPYFSWSPPKRLLLLLRMVELEVPSVEALMPTLIYLYTGTLPLRTSCAPNILLGLLHNAHYLQSKRLIHVRVTRGERKEGKKLPIWSSSTTRLTDEPRTEKTA